MHSTVYHVHKRFVPQIGDNRKNEKKNNNNANDERLVWDEEVGEFLEEETPLLPNDLSSSSSPPAIASLSMLPPPKSFGLGLVKLDRKSIVVALDSFGGLQAWDRDYKLIGKDNTDKPHLEALSDVFPKEEMKKIKINLMIPSVDSKQIIVAGRVEGNGPPQQVIQIWRRTVDASTEPRCLRTKTIKVKFPIYSMCLSTDGAMLFVGSDNGKIYVINDKDHKVKQLVSDVKRETKDMAKLEKYSLIVEKPDGPHSLPHHGSDGKVYPVDHERLHHETDELLPKQADKYKIGVSSHSPNHAHGEGEVKEDEVYGIDVEANLSDDEADDLIDDLDADIDGDNNKIVSNICMTTDMDYLVVSMGGDIIVYRFNRKTRSSATEKHRIHTHAGKKLIEGNSDDIPNRCMCISYDDKLIFSVAQGESSIRVWNLVKGNPVRILKSHTEPVTSLTAFPDGLRLLSTSRDCTGIIWEITTGDALQALDAHNAPLTCSSISDDSRLIVTGSDDGDVCLWTLTRPPSLEAHEQEHKKEEMIDRFGYRFYAQGIASALKRIHSPYCIGLYSQGGRGKTFMIGMLKRAFDGEIQEHPRTKQLVQIFERKKRQNLRKKIRKAKYLQLKNDAQVEKKLGNMKDLYDTNDDDDFIASDDETKMTSFRIRCQKAMETPVYGFISLLYAICPACELPIATLAEVAIQSSRLLYFVLWSLYRRGFQRTFGSGRSRSNLGYEALNQMDEDDAYAANQEAEIYGTVSKKTSGEFSNMADEAGVFDGQSMEYIFVDFNAWEFSDSNYLWAGMIRNIYACVEKRLDSDKDGTNSMFQRSWKVKWRVKKAMSILHQKFGGPGQLAVVFFFSNIVIIMLIVVLACSTEGAIQFWGQAVSTGKKVVRVIAGVIATIAGLAPTITFAYRVVVSSSVSQGDAIFDKAEKGSIRDKIGFMNHVRDEVDELFDFIAEYKKGMKVDMKLLLFVDDLDRCFEGKNVKALEAIQLILTIPGAPIFIFLACDSRIMVSSIDERLRTSINLNIAAISGWEYLEKLVDLPFCLPEPGKEILHNFLTYSVNNSLTGVSNLAMQIRLFYSKVQSYCTLQEKSDGKKRGLALTANSKKFDGDDEEVKEVEATVEWFVVFPMPWLQKLQTSQELAPPSSEVKLLEQATTSSTTGENKLITASADQTNASNNSTTAISSPNIKADMLERALKTACKIYDETFIPEERLKRSTALINALARQLEAIMPTTGYFDTNFSSNPEQFEKLRYKVVECLRNVQFKPVLVAKEKEPEKVIGIQDRLKVEVGPHHEEATLLNSVYRSATHLTTAATNGVANTSIIFTDRMDELNEAVDNAMESMVNNFSNIAQTLSRPISSYTRAREGPTHAHSGHSRPTSGHENHHELIKDIVEVKETEDEKESIVGASGEELNISTIAEEKENEIGESKKIKEIPPEQNPFFLPEFEHDHDHHHDHTNADLINTAGEAEIVAEAKEDVPSEKTVEEVKVHEEIITQPNVPEQVEVITEKESPAQLGTPADMMVNAPVNSLPPQNVVVKEESAPKEDLNRAPSSVTPLSTTVVKTVNRVIETGKSPLPLPPRQPYLPPLRTQSWRSTGRIFDPILPRESVRLLEEMTRISHASPRKLKSILTFLRIIHDVANCKPIDDEKQSLTLLDDLPEWSTFTKKLVKWIYLCELYPFRMSILVLILMDLDQMFQYVEKENEVFAKEGTANKKSEVIYWRNRETVEQVTGRTVTVLDEVVVSPESNEDTTCENLHAFYFRYVENVVIQLQGRDNLKNISKLDGDLEEFALLLQMPLITFVKKKIEKTNNIRKTALVTERVIDGEGKSQLIARPDWKIDIEGNDSDDEDIVTYDDIVADDVLGKRPSLEGNKDGLRCDRLSHLSLMSYAFNLNPAIRHQVATEVASMSTKSSARLSGFELRVNCW